MRAMARSSGPANPADAPIGLLRGLARFAVGGFLYGMIIPIPTYPLSAIHPKGSIPSSSPEGAFSAVSSSPFRVRVKSPSGP